MNERGETSESQKIDSRKRAALIGTFSGFFLIALAFFIYWFLALRFEESTKDAYVQGNKVELTSQVSGVVVSINADETDYVKEGQILIQLDKADSMIALEKSKQLLGESVRNVVRLFLEVEQLEAALEMKEVVLLKAQQDFDNRIDLVRRGAISEEEFNHVKAALEVASGAVKKTSYALRSVYAQIQGTTVQTHPLVAQAAQQVKEDWMRLKRCDILSPVSGYVANRTVQLGESITTLNPLLAIIPLDELWVDANFKETQLVDIRIGQSVKMYSDVHGRGVLFQGKILGINPGTGSLFSLLPPQNATGNWVKVIQRVPVRVSLEGEQIKMHPLWPGLSMKVMVNIRNKPREMFMPFKQEKPLYQTAVYEQQELGVDQIIGEIIRESSGKYGRK